MCRYAPGWLWITLLAAVSVSPKVYSAEDDLPYTAYVVTSETEVRSGPGDSYYCTERLVLGAEVEVHRRDPGGWLAIRPPADSFCWIPSEKLKRTETTDVAEVTASDAVAWMGSNVQSVQRHRWQVRLEPGERVAVLGIDSRDDAASGKARPWFKIAPPAGEFRWVHSDDVRRVRSNRPAARGDLEVAVARPAAKPTPAPTLKVVRTNPAPASTPAANSTESQWTSAKKRSRDVVDPQVRQAVATSSEPPAAEDVPAPRRRGPSMVLTNVGQVAPAEAQESDNAPSSVVPAQSIDRSPAPPAPNNASAPAANGTRVVWAPRSPRREVEQLDNASPISVTPMPVMGRSDTEVEREDIELQLSLMVSRDPQLWNLAALRGRAEALLERSPSPLERGQVRLLLDQIVEFEDLYERHVATEKGVLVPNAPAAPGAVTRTSAAARVEPRFDGSGWLIPVHSVKRTAPPYAITDDGGKVLLYVTPAPGVNLHRYERKRVGIYGQRNSAQDLSVQVLTAHRVIDIERHATR